MIAAPSFPSSTLIRRIGGIEWPTVGSWRIPPIGGLEIRRTRRFLPRRAHLRVCDGALTVVPDGLGSQLTIHPR